MKRCSQSHVSPQGRNNINIELIQVLHLSAPGLTFQYYKVSFISAHSRSGRLNHPGHPVPASPDLFSLRSANLLVLSMLR